MNMNTNKNTNTNAPNKGPAKRVIAKVLSSRFELGFDGALFTLRLSDIPHTRFIPTSVLEGKTPAVGDLIEFDEDLRPGKRELSNVIFVSHGVG